MRDKKNGDIRRQVLRAIGAVGWVAVQPLGALAAQGATQHSSGASSSARRFANMIGANGWAGSDNDLSMWKKMGISWGRGVVGPGQMRTASDDMRVDKTGTRYDSDLAPVILRNNRAGIHSLLLLAYTPPWNASVPGDSKSAPVDVGAWERYVEAVVRTYSAPPYNVRYFQIWNEAAGKLSGGAKQATFWHGPGGPDGQEGRAAPYQRAMQDYVERIHIPAARIVRKHGAYVVYGGWPDQGGLDTYSKWLEFKSPQFNQRMLDCVDFIDTHYLDVKDFDYLYSRYVKQGPARGLWQTEIGDRFMIDNHYLPRYFFRFAVWALDRNWDQPDKYVSMVYHWDGPEPFRLTHRSPGGRSYNVSGESLAVLGQVAGGALSPLSPAPSFRDDCDGSALYSDGQIVMQVRAPSGWQTVDIPGLPASSWRRAKVQFIDALTGTPSPDSDTEMKWEGDRLSIRFNVPNPVNGNKPARRKGRDDSPQHLAYIVIHT